MEGVGEGGFMAEGEELGLGEDGGEVGKGLVLGGEALGEALREGLEVAEGAHLLVLLRVDFYAFWA